MCMVHLLVCRLLSGFSFLQYEVEPSPDWRGVRLRELERGNLERKVLSIASGFSLRQLRNGHARIGAVIVEVGAAVFASDLIEHESQQRHAG